MKKIIVALSFFISSQIYALPDGIDVQYLQKSYALINKSKHATAIMFDLLAISEDHPLNETQAAQLVNAVCEAVKYDIEFASFIETDIKQARIVFQDDQLNEKSLQNIIKDTTEYQIYQQFIGTKNECKL